MKRSILFVSFIAFCWLCVSCYRGWTRFETGEHVDSYGPCPMEATDICYYRSYIFTAFEFQIPEEAFKQWADGWRLTEIEGSVPLRRYTEMTLPYPEFPDDANDDEAMSRFDADMAKRTAVITNGLYHHTEFGGGGGIRIGYDRDLQRAYFESQPR